MNEDLPAYGAGTGTGVGTGAGPGTSVPRWPLATAAFLTSIPGLLVGGLLVVAVSISMLEGEEDEWGVGPFLLGVGLVLFTLAAVAIALAVLGRRAEKATHQRSAWSVLGLALAITAAVPSVLLIMLFR